MLLNYTSKVDADKTAQEIAKILSTHGASAVMTEYDSKEGFITALSFKIKMNDKELAFRLPSDWRPVAEILNRGKRTSFRDSIVEERKRQAIRTAWRIVKDWVEAQCALIDTQMVSTAQVFLPYAVMRDGRTLSEHVASDPKFLLGSGE